MGFASYRRGVGQAWHRSRKIDGREVSNSFEQTAIPDVAGVLEKPCRGSRIDRLLYGSHDQLQSSIRPAHTLASPAQGDSLQRHRESDRAVGSPADGRSLPVI